MSDTTTTTDPHLGVLLAARYRLVARLGDGGMATVFRARDEVLNRDVAVKLLHPSLSAEPDLVARFRMEAKNAARLSHPNIATVYDSGEQDGLSFIVMELVDGITLRALLERFGYFDPPTARHVARGIAAALDHAHTKGIVHRDVKPENVILTPDGEVRVVDFGIAKAAGGGGARLTTDRGLGTVAYVAPEQLTPSDVDGRADVFALGVVTFEMLTGRAPYAGDTAQALAAARLRGAAPAAGISPSIDGAIIRATATDPDDRFATAGTFARALGAGDANPSTDAPSSLVATDHLPDTSDALPAATTTTTGVLPFEARLRRRARRRAVIGALTALCLVAAGIAAYLVWPKPITVPELRSQSFEQARATLEREGLAVGAISEVFHDVVPSGSVVETEPSARTQVQEATEIDVAISKGPQLFAIPDIVGQPLEDARAAFSEEGFTLVVDEEVFHDDIPEGAVVSRDPKVASAKQGTAFTVVVSKGPEFIAIPPVAGETAAAAQSALEGAGFTHATSTEFSDSVEEGMVIGTQPSTEAPKGSQVTIVVSKGPKPFPMPDFVGMQLSGARERAKSLGLVVANAYAVPGSDNPSGRVQGQNPPEGTSVRKGTKIDLWYAS